jgi:hypothetical protein
MAKAGAPKKQKPKPKLSDKEQFERFKETARKLGVDESGDRFERAFKKLAKPASTPSNESPKPRKMTGRGR